MDEGEAIRYLRRAQELAWINIEDLFNIRTPNVCVPCPFRRGSNCLFQCIEDGRGNIDTRKATKEVYDDIFGREAITSPTAPLAESQIVEPKQKQETPTNAEVHIQQQMSIPPNMDFIEEPLYDEQGKFLMMRRYKRKVTPRPLEENPPDETKSSN